MNSITNCRESNCSVTAVSKTNGYRIVKRALDILISLTAIILLWLPMLIIALIIRIESPGGALFRQQRIGLGGKEFTVLKFRSMYRTAPSETATCDLTDAQTHITHVGAFLRKTSLDELPQLFNVLRGDMSLIGPRPLIVSEDKIHVMRQEAGVYTIRPGITGWAQINGRDCIDAETKVRLDTEYLRNLSFAMDAKIVLSTLFVVSSRDGYAEGDQHEQNIGGTSTDMNDTDYYAA